MVLKEGGIGIECYVSVNFQVVCEELGSDGRVEKIRNIIYE